MQLALVPDHHCVVLILHTCPLDWCYYILSYETHGFSPPQVKVDTQKDHDCHSSFVLHHHLHCYSRLPILGGATCSLLERVSSNPSRLCGCAPIAPCTRETGTPMLLMSSLPRAGHRSSLLNCILAQLSGSTLAGRRLERGSYLKTVTNV